MISWNLQQNQWLSLRHTSQVSLFFGYSLNETCNRLMVKKVLKINRKESQDFSLKKVRVLKNLCKLSVSYYLAFTADDDS